RYDLVTGVQTCALPISGSRHLPPQPRTMRPAERPSMAPRLDQWLVDQGRAATRSAAQAAIMAGLVTVDGQPADKPGRRIDRGGRSAERRVGGRGRQTAM